MSLNYTYRFHMDFVALGRWRGPKTKSTEKNKERWKIKKLDPQGPQHH